MKKKSSLKANLLTSESSIEVSHRNYLLQINRIKLQDYIQCGLIAPDIYLGDEIEKDIQSNNPHFLVLSEGYLEELDEQQILLEIVFTEEEKKKLQFIHEALYCSFPLPITRIVKVYAQDETIIQHIIAQISNSEGGFLPARLFESYTKNQKIIFEPKTFLPPSEDMNGLEWKNQIMQFDKRMGMFSFMKNSTLYYADDTKKISNYSDHYFTLLSKMVPHLITTDRTFDGLSFFKECENFKTLLYSEKQIDEAFIRKVAQDIFDEDVKTLFLKILEPNSTRKTLPLLFEKKANLYSFIALIYYFRDKKSNRKDSFKTDIKNIIPESIAESALAILGIYFGYKSLRAQEEITLKEPIFNKFFGNSANMKFQLDSELDYITIEAIYHYSFYPNDAKDVKFDHLIYPNPMKPMEFPNDKEFITWYRVEQKMYLNSFYIQLCKKTYEEVIDDKLRSYPEEIVLGDHYLLAFIAKFFENLLVYETNTGSFGKLYCKNTNLVNFLKETQGSLQENELFAMFELDHK